MPPLLDSKYCDPDGFIRRWRDVNRRQTNNSLPAVTFFPVVRRFINWRALSLSLFFMLLVSLLWEATLAVPYNWWSFQHRQMIGLFIGAWSGLPIEEVCVWIAVTYATAIVFEVVKIFLASERPVRDALFGKSHQTNGAT
jgi:hypothetical protein